jgi:hypothetical protein
MSQNGGKNQVDVRRCDSNPPLPNGYSHIRSAIRALMAAETPPNYTPNDAGGTPPAAVDKFRQALSELRKGAEDQSRTEKTPAAD